MKLNINIWKKKPWIVQKSHYIKRSIPLFSLFKICHFFNNQQLDHSVQFCILQSFQKDFMKWSLLKFFNDQIIS